MTKCIAIGIVRGTCVSVEFLKGYIVICWNAEGVHSHLSECWRVHGKRKVGNSWIRTRVSKLWPWAKSGPWNHFICLQTNFSI